MQPTSTGVDWRFLTSWKLLNLVGWAVAMWTMILIRVDYLDVIVGGLLIGTAQWLGLRMRFAHAWWWLFAYGVGWAVAIFVSGELGFFAPDPLSLGIVGGFLAGFLQWFALRRYVHRSLVWPISLAVDSAIACSIAYKVGNALYNHDLSEPVYYLVAGAVAGVLLGGLSAITLWWLQRRPIVSA